MAQEREQLEFDEWWAEFQRESLRDPYADAGRLRRYFTSLDLGKRSSFEASLIQLFLDQRPGCGCVAAVLDGEISRSGCDLLRGALPEISGDGIPEEEQRSTIVRILASSNMDKFLDVVEEFLIERPIGFYFSTVPWSLWPRQAGLFRRAFYRYFANADLARIEGTAVLQASGKTPEALAAVREEYEARGDSSGWAQLAIAFRHTRFSFLSDRERQELEAVLA